MRRAAARAVALSGLLATLPNLLAACKLDPNPAWGAQTETGSGDDSSSDSSSSSDGSSSDTTGDDSTGSDTGDDSECPAGSDRQAAPKDNPNGEACMVDADGDGWGARDGLPPLAGVGRDCDDDDPEVALCIEPACADQPGADMLSYQLVADPHWDDYEWRCAPAAEPCGLTDISTSTITLSPVSTTTVIVAGQLEPAMGIDPVEAQATVHTAAAWDLGKGCSLVELQAGLVGTWAIGEHEVTVTPSDNLSGFEGAWLFRCPIATAGASIQLQLGDLAGGDASNWVGLVWGYRPQRGMTLMQWYAAADCPDSPVVLTRLDASPTGFDAADFDCGGQPVHGVAVANEVAETFGWDAAGTYTLDVVLTSEHVEVRVDGTTVASFDPGSADASVTGEFGVVLPVQVGASFGPITSSCWP